ncbi:hypothetical protein VJ786_08325 [Sphingobacterium sp. PU5-4]|uniref:Uncharacterized protein n=1 Tax=Sphingobacterium tenebrionis TaxID=3111775 RepID=A0ABU8I628_9SPHI
MEQTPLEFKVALSNDQVELIKSFNTIIDEEEIFDEESFYEFIKNIIKDFSKKSSTGENVEGMILNYMLSLDQSEHGAPEISDYTLETLNANLNTLEGNFELCYSVYYYYGCDDLTQDSDKKLDFDFTIDLENKYITFVSQNNFTRFSSE